MIVAIDGPAGAGKSTAAKKVAERLGFIYIDTGAMYRALTLKVLNLGIAIDDIPSIVDLLRRTEIDLEGSTDIGVRVLLDSKDVSGDIRLPRVSAHVSDIARIPEVRKIMLGLQREMGKRGNVIMDGRDIGTVVFPNAERKIFLDADFQERVNRRFNESSGINRKQVEDDLANRDLIDSSREVAPLKKAADAIYIDSTDMPIEQVVEAILQEVETER